jgi:predicted metal-dependent phosphoesterase TrpH
LFQTSEIKDKIISSEKAAELMEDGWCKADMHVHTCCSHDVPPAWQTHPSRLFEKAKSMGLDYVTFTDHDTIKAYDMLGWDRKDLTPGVEISIKDIENVGHTVHMNAFAFDREQYQEIELLARKEKNIYSVIDYLKSNDLPYIYNHPFWFKFGEKPNILAVPELVKHFPVVEYNAQDLRQKNFFSMVLAQRYNKGVAINTDSHTGNIGKVYTLAQGDTFHEYFSNISKGRSYLVMEEPAWKHFAAELGGLIELLFSIDKGIWEETGFSTGIGAFDRVMSALARDMPDRSNKLNKATASLARQVAGSRLPVFLHMISKKSQVTRIERMVNA